MLKSDVAGPVALVLVSPADKRHTLCNVSKGGWLNLDGLGVTSRQNQYT